MWGQNYMRIQLYTMLMHNNEQIFYLKTFGSHMNIVFLDKNDSNSFEYVSQINNSLAPVLLGLLTGSLRPAAFTLSSQALEVDLHASCHLASEHCNLLENIGMQPEYKMLQVIKFIRMACHYFCVIIQLLQLLKVINHGRGDKLRS